MTIAVNFTCQRCGTGFAATGRHLACKPRKFCRSCGHYIAAAGKRAKREANVGIWFWQKVDSQGGEGACWPWLGSLNTNGYGKLVFRGKITGAHRVALSLAKGAPPFDEAEACHTCDNRLCVNPAHLWWGTRRDNALDAVTKGRTRWKHPTHCLNGHPRTADNIVTYKNGPKVQRHCRACYADRGAARSQVAQ